MLQGYSQLIFEGALVTLELALSSVLLAVVIGLIGAGGKLSQNPVISTIFGAYTTLIRGVPDLVLMLLIFYGLQIALNSVTEFFGFSQIDIDPLGRALLPWALSTEPILPKPSGEPTWRCLVVRSRRLPPSVFPTRRFSVAFCFRP